MEHAATPADIALGQQDLTHAVRPNAATATNLIPADVCFADGSLVVADSGQLRVLIWRTIPTSSGAAADVVLGQSALDVTAAGTTDARSVMPRSVRYNGGLLYVSTGNRILVWRGLPTVNDAPADLVIGQPVMTQDLANGGGIGGDTLQSPGGIGFTSDGRVLIADGANGRVVIRPAP